MRIIVVNVNTSESMTGEDRLRLAGLSDRCASVRADAKKITAWPLSAALGLRPAAAGDGPAGGAAR